MLKRLNGSTGRVGESKRGSSQSEFSRIRGSKKLSAEEEEEEEAQEDDIKMRSRRSRR